MSNCDGCGHDDFQSFRRKPNIPHRLMWLCSSCDARLRGLPVPEPFQERRRFDVFSPVAIISAASVLVSLILALGAHL